MTRHPTDTVSLVAGLFFLGVVATWLLDRGGLLPGSRGWLVPLMLIGVGVVGLLSARPRRRASTGTGTGSPDDD